MDQVTTPGDAETIHSPTHFSAAKNYLIELNKVLLNNDTGDIQRIPSGAIEKYFENIRLIFKEFLQAMSASTNDESRQAFLLEMCELNALYSVQLKLKYELAVDLAEIAYDFDNPDYPGLAHVINKIENKQYLIQTEKF